MTWRPFATKPKRADTPEAAGLNEGAPRSYSTCSLQGCGSSRCKSGRGKLTICPRSHVRRSFEVTHGNESSNVKVLVGEGQATVRAAASSELHSLVRAAHVYRFKWDYRRRRAHRIRAKAITGGRRIVLRPPGLPGYGRRHERKDSQLKAGTSWPPAVRQRPACEMQ